MSRYTGKVKVVGTDLLCFPADPVTLDALGTCCYDAYAWSDIESGPVETIDVSEWSRRRDRKRAADQQDSAR
jgi:hypothetical protein